MERTYTVYYGRLNGNIVYVGTTIQKPEDRFRWHKHNGKDFQFEVVKTFSTSEEMLDFEFSEIKRLNPSYNKITSRKQNLNSRLTASDLEMRRGSKEWCQSCLKRRVNSGYKKCRFC
jgi:hypothetical protein